MLNKWRIFWLSVVWSVSLSGLAGASGPLTSYMISEIKLFSLQDRQVVAIALDDRISGKGIDEVLGYRLKPSFEEQREIDRLTVTLSNVSFSVKELPPELPLQLETLRAGRLKISLKGAAAARAEVSTVHRKTVKDRDGTIKMRTYLVFNIPTGLKKDLPTVVLDPGHGGPDSGAVQNFIHEKDLNLDITLRAARLFADKGWNVVLTRRTDVEPSLLERADAANIVNATVFISVHHNSLPEETLYRSREFGTTVLYNSSALNPAYDLARIMQDELIGSLGTQREVMQDRPKLVVLNSTWVPSVLPEGVMMPNPANAKLILDRFQRQRSAEAIVRATENWHGRKVLAARKPAKVGPQLAIRLTGDAPSAGNQTGNSANRGTVAGNGGWVYYLRKADSVSGSKEQTLWRFHPDRFMSDQLVADQEAWDINVTADGVYYSNWSDGQALYRVAPDGSDSRKMTDGPVQQLSFSADRIVFVRNRQIYTMPRSGGMALQVNEDVAENAVIWGDWIYYANGSDGFRPYRVHPDGTGRAKISEDETLFMIVAGEWLFYSNLSDGEKLYRVKTDGSGRSKICDDRVGYLNFDQNFIYFSNTNHNNGLFRIQPDGSGKSKVLEGETVAGPIGVVGGKLYYQGKFQDIQSKRIKAFSCARESAR